MNNPFWLVNSILVLYLWYALFFVYMARIVIPEREDIEPLLYSKTKTEQRIAINLQHIYENDLFDTYRNIPVPPKADILVPFPEPPRAQKDILNEIPKPKFLEPLNITLKGITFVMSDETKNKAIISLNKTDQEFLYKVGDAIEDALLIRIFNNKVVFLRINGQQEVLYLREEDAQQDPSYAFIGEWDQVVKSQGENHFLVNPKAFLLRIQNIAQCIDVLGLTTVYQKGVGVGTRIGLLDNGSLGTYLGFKTGDTITAINGIPATNTQERLSIYKSIVNTAINQDIIVELTRNKKKLELVYTLDNFGVVEPSQENGTVQTNATVSAPVKDNSEINDLEEEQFAYTLKMMHQHERNNMLANGKDPLSS